MLGFEPQIYGVGGDHYADCAKTSAQDDCLLWSIDRHY